jgi:hypothetical protein
VSTLNVRNPDFGTSLSGHSVIIKKISLPAMSPVRNGSRAAGWNSRSVRL